MHTVTTNNTGQIPVLVKEWIVSYHSEDQRLGAEGYALR
jgi:hypothetical protein